VANATAYQASRRAEAELAQTGRGLPRLRASARRVDGSGVRVEARLGGGWAARCVIVVSVRRASSGETSSAGAAGERLAIVAQHRAQPHERVVDVGDLGLLGLLVAPDRADEVAVQLRRRDGEQPMPDRR
jgi:hypothetical protein